MKKWLYFLVVIPLFIFSGCDDHDGEDDCTHSNNKVLMLQVNASSFEFEGGIEYIFNQKTDSFNLDVVLNWDTTSGTFFLNYRELNETLLYGTIDLLANGEILSPRSLQSPEYFETDFTDDIIFPSNGFTNVSLSQPLANFEYFNVWMSIQKLEKVRQYLRSNPNQKIKIFLYTPNVSYGTSYYLFIKN